MKKLLILLFLIIGYSTYSQTDNSQFIRFTNNIIFADSVRMDSLNGSGTILRIDENGYLYRNTGTSVDTIVIGQVTNLRQALDSLALTVDSNFNLSGTNFLSLNDSIWVEYIMATDVIKANNLEVFKNGATYLDVYSLDGGRARIRINELSTGDRISDILFFSDDSLSYGTRIRRSGGANSDFAIHNQGSGKIILTGGSGTDGIRVNQDGSVEVSQQYTLPTSDGSANQVIKTDGSGVLSFTNVQSPLTAGTNITISNDTISSTGGSDADWTINGNYIYNASDSIGIGTVTPSSPLDVKGFAQVTSSTTYAFTAQNSLTGTAGRFVSSNGSGIEITSNQSLGYGIRLNEYEVDSISNDATLAGNDAEDLVTEQAVKGYVDNAILNDTRVSWAADVDTSARVDGFVLKWNAGAGTHYYDTAGTGGGGSTYFRGQGLTLSANTFAIGDDSVTTAMLQDDAVTYSKIQNVGGNSVLARAASGSGNLSEVSLSTSQLLGRGSSGNISAISLSGLTMNGTTLSATNTGDITAVSAGNGLTGGGSSGAVTVTMGTPSTLTGSSTNSVGTSTHAHQLDFGTFKSNSYGFFLDTTRTTGEFLVDSGIGITTEEKVILFTMSGEADSVLLGSGYFTMSARVVINAVNNDTLSGVQNVSPNLPKYTIKAYLVNDVQTLGSVISGEKIELRTARVIDMFTAIKNGESTAEGIITMTMNTNPTKFRLTDGYFVAVTISATYGGVVDYVKHEDASMVIEKANDYNSSREQIFD